MLPQPQIFLSCFSLLLIIFFTNLLFLILDYDFISRFCTLSSVASCFRILKGPKNNHVFILFYFFGGRGEGSYFSTLFFLECSQPLGARADWRSLHYLTHEHTALSDFSSSHKPHLPYPWIFKNIWYRVFERLNSP